MKRNLFILSAVCLFFLISTKTSAQETWNEKDDMPIYRTQAMAFSIGTKGYVICGFDEDINGSTDLWEWDQTTETWTQMASLPGNSRASGIAFSLGEKGYLATGYEFGFYNDLWEWDQATDTWTQKSNIPADPRGQSAVFTIGTKAYIAGGFDENYNRLDEFWEWDQETENWTERASLPESVSASAAFSIEAKGYVVSGNGSIGQSSQLWEWDQATDAWISKATLPTPRAGAGSFSIGKKGYVSTGEGDTYLNDLWEWDQATDTWTQKADLPGSVRARSCSFSINNKGYILGGAFGPVGIFNEMWEWDPDFSTSINDDIILAGQLKVFPNPCGDYFNIQFNQSFNKVDLSISDVLGRLVHNERIDFRNSNHSVAINTNQLLSGVYILSIRTDGGVYSEKLEIQR